MWLNLGYTAPMYKQEKPLNDKKTIKDPHAEREALKYSNPIPSREVILALLDDSAGPRTREEIADTLHMDTDDQYEALRRRLIAMVRDGQIVCNRKGGYGRVDKMNLIRGRVLGHRDGYGFVLTGDGSEDIYLSNRQMRRVFDGDEVLVRLGDKGFRGRKEGSIVEILARNTQQLVGRYVVERGVHSVRPDNPKVLLDIMIPPDQTLNAKPGQLVVVDIIEYPERNNLPVGSIVEVLGDHLAPGMEIDVAIRSHGVPHVWPEEVTALADGFSPEVLEQDKAARFDIRALPLVTIDGEDARDFDDAVYCERKKGGGWRLFVAIADVSHYVQVGDALDREATLRSTSVYFPDFVVPMLPEALSNGLCSLKPEVDRLCMVCEMTVSARGRVSGYHFYEAVMHSHARLTYTQVGQMLAEKDKARSGIRKQFSHVVAHVDVLHELYQAFRAERDQRGAIEFETQETRILFDKDRKIKQIVPVTRNDAHKLIEECMLAANVCAAKFLEGHQLPALYRVHEGPKEQKLELLREYLGNLGLGLRSRDKVTPQDYQEVMDSIVGRPDAHLIQTMLLRSMNQAVYQPENKGHFGLAYDAYAHFTSPIRRYPDLLVHRAIRCVIRSSVESNKVKRMEQAKALAPVRIYPYSIEDMIVLGEQCSLAERRADDATRDVVSWLKCEYLQDRVGEEFEGVVAAVTSFGLFVELKDVYIEGLVHITSLPQDYYIHEPVRNRLIGERTRKAFCMGDVLRVRVMRVNLDERKIDFEVAEFKASKPKKASFFSRAKDFARELVSGKKKTPSTEKKSHVADAEAATTRAPREAQPAAKARKKAKPAARTGSKPAAKSRPAGKSRSAAKSKSDDQAKPAATSKSTAKPTSTAKPKPRPRRRRKPQADN